MSAPSDKVTDLVALRKKRADERYKRLVMKTFCDMEHADKREVLDRAAEVQIKARETL